MKIKSFIAASIEKAMVQIRNEMGPSALILETKECDGKGFKGFLGKTLVEVIAALPDEYSTQDDIELGDKDNVLTEGLEDQVGNVSGTDETVADENISRSRMLSILNERISRKQEGNTNENIIESELPETSNGLKVPHFQLPAQDSDLTNHDAQFNDAQFNSLLQTSGIEGMEAVNDSSAHVLLKGFINELVEQELEEEIINHLLDDFKISESGLIDIDKIKDSVRLRIAGMVDIKKIESSSNQKKVITFVGPTGVGKTTTLAKVAAKLAMDEGKDVGVITVDTYRIAAVDQLRAYADMIDIPIRVAHTPKELAESVNDFSDKEYILIDTVGRSQYDDKRIRMLKGLLKVLPSPENYLVINSSTRSSDASDIFKNFSVMPLHGFVFTKIDETKTFGMLLNMIVNTKLPVCCFTNGQEVPDDIVAANKEIIADLIVPLK